MGTTNAKIGITNTKQMDTNKKQVIKNKVKNEQLEQFEEIQQQETKLIKQNTYNFNQELQISQTNELIKISNVSIDPICIAKKQIAREGNNLTKNDLIAIIIALEPTQSVWIYQLNSLTIDDLNFIICSIIYTTNFISCKNN
jgi:hypothetical protein